MTTQEPATPPAPEPPPQPPPPAGPAPRRLLRSRGDRMLTGLAAGLAQHFDIDPVLVRAAFVVLALFNGLGILLYIVGSVIVPSEGARQGDPPARDLGDTGRALSIVFGLVLVAVGVGALLSRLRGIDVDWVAVACAGLIGVGAALLLTGGRLARGPLVTLGVILAVSLAPLTIFDTPMGAGSFGDRTERPRAMSDLPALYEHSFGSMTLDLRDLALPEGTTTVRTKTAFGSLQVFAPRDVAIEVVADASFGSVQALGQQTNGGPNVERTFRTADYERASKRLSLVIESSFGSVEVIR